LAGKSQSIRLAELALSTHCSHTRRFEVVVESYGSRRSDRSKWGSLLSRQDDVLPLGVPMRTEALAGASGAPA